MISHRSTTSSRRPGVTFNGIVEVDLVPLVKCLNCGGLRRHSFHPHSPRWQKVGPGQFRRVDCVGREIPS